MIAVLVRMFPVAYAIIEVKEGGLLLAKRPEGKCLSGYCEFPGGKIEKVESAADALVRELEQEVLIQTQVIHILEPVGHHYEKFSIRLIPCRARILAGLHTAAEHSSIAWFHFGKSMPIARTSRPTSFTTFL
jgi:8-oxo-dGTP diphosphatase